MVLQNMRENGLENCLLTASQAKESPIKGQTRGFTTNESDSHIL